MYDPYQQHRLGRVAIEVGTGYAWLDRIAGLWAVVERQNPAAFVAATHAARIAIERGCLAVLELAEQSVGASGLIWPHPLERLVRDLRTYLRQPNPDGALAGVGAAVAADLWDPTYEFAREQKTFAETAHRSI